MEGHIAMFVDNLLKRAEMKQVTYDHITGVVDGLLTADAITLDESKRLLSAAWRATR